MDQKVERVPLNIIFRSCSKVHATHGGDRPCGASKRQVIFCCLKSLLDSIGDGDSIVHILDDHSDEDDVKMMKDLLSAHGPNHKFVPLDVTGNGNSMEACFRYAKDNAFELTYFVEDDYLHLPIAIKAMLDFYWSNPGDRIIHPTDYMDRYTRTNEPYLYDIFLSGYRHWRTIRHTTVTFMISDRVLDIYWDNYMALAEGYRTGKGSEDDSINLIYEEETCVSPIPSLAAHFSPSPAMPPFINWRKFFRRLLKDFPEGLAPSPNKDESTTFADTSELSQADAERVAQIDILETVIDTAQDGDYEKALKTVQQSLMR
jgi:hypothetical protein